MKKFDRAEVFDLYVRCFQDIIDVLEQMYLEEYDMSYEDRLNYEIGIDGFKYAMNQINKNLVDNNEPPFAIFTIHHGVANA